MSKFKIVKISDFLTDREERYKPDDPNLDGLKRLNKIDFSGNIHQSDKPTKTDMIIVYPGDLVISGINVQKGAIAVYQGKQPITATIHYSSYTFDGNEIDIEYFKRFLKSPEFLKTLKEQVKGGIKTEIKPKSFLPIEIKLPDLSQQQKINKYFESFEQELTELKAELNNQEKYISQLKQAILQEAIAGQLTAEWRDRNPMQKGDPDTDAAALLAKIKAEKQQAIADGKLKQEKPLPKISSDEIPFSLPDSWVWCRLGEICKTLSTGPFGLMLHKSDYENNGIPVVNPTNIIKGLIFAESKMLISEKTVQRLRRYQLHQGDIVIARRGNLEKCAVVQNKQDGWLCGTGSFFMRLIIVNNDFFVMAYCSKKSQSYLLEDSIGQTMNNLNQKLLIKMPFPLPPLAEQKAIVEKVDYLMKIIDQLEEQIKHRKQLAEDLMQTVLREAFE